MLVDELVWEASDTRARDESGAATCQWCRHPQSLPEPPPRREFWSNGAEHGGCRAPWPQWPQHASAADACNDSSMIDLAQDLSSLASDTPVPSPWRYSGGQLPVSTSLAVCTKAATSRVSGCSPAASSMRLTWAAVWHLALHFATWCAMCIQKHGCAWQVHLDCTSPRPSGPSTPPSTPSTRPSTPSTRDSTPLSQRPSPPSPRRSHLTTPAPSHARYYHSPHRARAGVPAPDYLKLKLQPTSAWRWSGADPERKLPTAGPVPERSPADAARAASWPPFEPEPPYSPWPHGGADWCMRCFARCLSKRS